MADLTVSKLAHRVGLTPATIRYYEEAGLLPEPRRGASGYRLYDDDMADRLRFIKGAQRLGLRLREIRELLGVLDRGLCPCGHTESLLRQRLTAIDEEARRLRVLKRELSRVLDGFPAEPSNGAGRWPCETEFIRAAEGKEARHSA